MLEAAAKGPEALGQDPETGKSVFLKAGRFGPYVQLGEAEDGEKPKMASLLPGMAEADVDLALALRLLSLPRVIGLHPETGEEVLAANGRFGPYVKSGEEIRSIPAGGVSPLDITLQSAVELLQQPKGRRGRAAPAAPLKELGPHPGTDKPLKILAGRFGPYVTDGEINASVPRGTAPEDVTVAQAVALLEARALRIAEGGGKRPLRKKAAKKTSKKKATKKTKKTSKKT
jgi:DNA topoisomerase-1